MGQGTEGNALTFLTCPTVALSGPASDGRTLYSSFPEVRCLVCFGTVWFAQTSSTLLTHSAHVARFQEPS